MQAPLRRRLYLTQPVVVLRALALCHTSGLFHVDGHLHRTGFMGMILQSFIPIIRMSIDLITGRIVYLYMTVYHRVRTAMSVRAKPTSTRGIDLEVGGLIQNHTGRAVHLFGGSLY